MNKIMIIGDGMGSQEVGLLMSYVKQSPNSIIKSRTTSFDRILKNGGVLGLSITHTSNVVVTDSAASASQLATGEYSGSEIKVV